MLELFVSDGGASLRSVAEELVHRGAQVDTMRGFEEDQVPGCAAALTAASISARSA